MKIGIFGTGMVGESIATKLIELGHEVMMGSRDSKNEKAVSWAQKMGDKASNGTFGEAGAFGELLFNCTSGEHSLEALKTVSEEDLKGKILIDVANPIAHDSGMPPTFFVSNTDSLGEQIQKEFPDVKVVKSLNTLSASLMGHPENLPEETDIFVSGNDKGAKETVTKLLTEFGWKRINDLGDISTARGSEMYLALWLRMWGVLQSPNYNIKFVKDGK